MNKILKTTLLTFIAVFGIGFLLSSPAYVLAQTQNPDDLIIIFTPNPLFSEGNFLPGDTVSGSAKVKNKSGSTQQIITEAINIEDPDNLAEVFDFKIKDTGKTYFDGTLAEFFDTREVKLSNLDNGVTTTYEFLITFQPGTEDKKYQGKTLKKFDIMIGFSGDEGGWPIVYACNDGVDNDSDGLVDMADPGCASPTDGDETDTASPGSTGGGGSGGGGGLPPGLIILNVTATTVATNATITWLTSHAATSQVIYSETPGTFDLSQGPPKYGYTYTKDWDDVFGNGKDVGHQVTLEGLISGTIYYYRCVSHGSPLTTSYEGTFTTKSAAAANPYFSIPELPSIPDTLPDATDDSNLPDSDALGELLPKPSEDSSLPPAESLAYLPVGSGAISPVFEDVSDDETPTITEEGLSSLFGEDEEKENGFNFLTGAILPAFKYFSTVCGRLLLLLALIIFYLLFYRRKRKKEEGQSTQN